MTPPGTAEIAIERLGARGDGIGRHAGAPVYVPAALPGERVRARIEGRRGDGWAAALIEVVVPSPDRVKPPCPHFAACGGCAWQHLAPARYRELKGAQLAEALARRGIALEPEAPRIVPQGDRRRVRFAGIRHGAKVWLGLHERAGRAVVDLNVCPVAATPLVALLAPLRALALLLRGLDARKPVRFVAAMTLAETGVDLTLSLPAAPGPEDRATLAAFAEAEDLARVSWRRADDEDDETSGGEPVVMRRPVQVTVGGVTLDLPPDAFLQASRAGEAAMQAVVAEAVAAAPKGAVVDLFAGCGGLSLPVIRARAVRAFDASAEAVQALDAAARGAGLAGRLRAERRDLARRPLRAEEFAGAAVVIFDPPRAGAAAQAREIARSRVPVAVAASCDPVTLARDLKILVDGGYAVGRVVPIDQFLWSSRIEAIAVLNKREA